MALPLQFLCSKGSLRSDILVPLARNSIKSPKNLQMKEGNQLKPQSVCERCDNKSHNPMLDGNEVLEGWEATVLVISLTSFPSPILNCPLNVS